MEYGGDFGMALLDSVIENTDEHLRFTELSGVDLLNGSRPLIGVRLPASAPVIHHGKDRALRDTSPETGIEA